MSSALRFMGSATLAGAGRWCGDWSLVHHLPCCYQPLSAGGLGTAGTIPIVPVVLLPLCVPVHHL